MRTLLQTWPVAGAACAMTRTSAADRPDSALVERARSGDGEAFDELVRRHQDRLWGFLASWVRDPDDRQELVQEVFLAAFRGIGRFRGDARFRTWLFQIAVNQARAFRRRAARRPPLLEIDALTEPDLGLPNRPVAPAPDAAAAGREARERIWDLVAEMPESWQAALRLRYLEGLSQPEIARALGVPVGTVKVHLHRARKRLAEAAIVEELAP